MDSARGPYELRMDGSGTVRRLTGILSGDELSANRDPARDIRSRKDTPAIRRIAPRNEFVMFIGLVRNRFWL
jgi:hypothetical protein